MKINRFDVVELNNGNRATILDTKDRQTYFADIHCHLLMIITRE